MCIVQGRNEVRWRLEHETSLPPHVRTWGLSEANVLFWKKVLMTLLELFRPPQWFGAEVLCPLAPSLRLWCYAMKIGKFSESKQIFKSEHLQFSKTIRHGSCTDWQQRLLAAFQVSSCSFVSLPCLPHAFLRCGPVFVLLVKKHFGHSISNFFKVRKVWE